MPSATLLLPATARLAGVIPAGVAKVLGRSDRGTVESGERAQLRRHFRLVPDHWPVAALTRDLDAADATSAAWLRADPAHVRPDINGARLLSYGEALGLTAEDVEAFLPALKPVFGDFGCPIDAPTPSRWYLRLPKGMPLPEFAEPESALGDDLAAYLPAGDAGRRWRALLTEAQVVLHQHPCNARRAAEGKAPVNSLWFWGAGAAPSSTSSVHDLVRSQDALVQALASAAGTSGSATKVSSMLLDLRHLRLLEQLTDEFLPPLLDELRQGRLKRLMLDFEDGERFVLESGQRWRFWRRPLASLIA